MAKWYRWGAGLMFVVGTVLASAVATGSPSSADFEYVGSKTCKKCHLDQYKSWSATRMARSFHVLKPNAQLKPDKKTGLTKEFIEEVKATKTRAGIDPEKDYTQDPKCLKCHTTGYGQPGGYATPAPDDRKAARKAAALASVGCEACHGPGSKYVEILKEIQKEQRQYTREELYAAGMNKIGSETCTGCHSKTENPTAGADYKFDYEQGKEKDTHKHLKMKLRKE